MEIEIKCRNFGESFCLGDVDLNFTMNFEDIDKGHLYWCSYCGPKAIKIHDILAKTMKNSGPEFIAELETVITKIEQDRKNKQS